MSIVIGVTPSRVSTLKVVKCGRQPHNYSLGRSMTSEGCNVSPAYFHLLKMSEPQVGLLSSALSQPWESTEITNTCVILTVLCRLMMIACSLVKAKVQLVVIIRSIATEWF